MKKTTVIALVGMRGSGKSSTGALLASRLAWRFIDTDREIEARLGRSIEEMFASGDEPLFREAEAAMTLEALAADGVVVATGGGCVENPSTRAALGTVFTAWLTAPAGVLASRIEGSTRPALTGLQPMTEVEAVLARREPWYGECASATVNTEPLMAAEVADAVEHAWRMFQADHVR